MVIDRQGSAYHEASRGKITQPAIFPDDGMPTRLADHVAVIVDPPAGHSAEIARHAVLPQKRLRSD